MFIEGGQNLQSKVLLIDDEPLILELLKAAIEQIDCLPILKQSGLDGYQSYLDDKPDLIITDLQMPGMNGFSLIEKIRSHDSSLPIIAISGDFPKEDTQRHDALHVFLEKMNIKGYLEKPVHITDIIDLVEMYLN